METETQAMNIWYFYSYLVKNAENNLLYSRKGNS